MKFPGFLYILFCVVLLFSCREEFERERCEPDKEIAADFAQYWYFKTGSWWIYKLDTSVDIYDTVFGRSYINRIHASAESACSYPEYIQALTHTNLNYFLPLDSNSDYSGEYFNSERGDYLAHHSYSVNIFDYETLLKYPFTIGDSVVNRYLAVNLLSDIDTFTSVVGKFDSTIHLVCKSTPKPNMNKKYFTEMYLAKRAGIVKIKYSNGEVWNLVKYEIKK